MDMRFNVCYNHQCGLTCWLSLTKIFFFSFNIPLFPVIKQKYLSQFCLFLILLLSKLYSHQHSTVPNFMVVSVFSLLYFYTYFFFFFYLNLYFIFLFFFIVFISLFLSIFLLFLFSLSCLRDSPPPTSIITVNPDNYLLSHQKTPALTHFL